MRLFATGLFVRAARSARLNASLRCPKAAPLSPSITRWSSSQAVERREDETHNTGSAYPTQTELRQYQNDNKPQTGSGTDTRQAFKEVFTGESQRNEIISREGLSRAFVEGESYVFDETSNLSPSIWNYIGRRLYMLPNHPICITRKLIESVFKGPTFKNHIASNPVVTTEANFDVLGFPKDHPGRSRTDTYYVNSSHVLRTHTSAHQLAAFQHMSKHNEKGYTICADVYRRDSIDHSHFPVFHQMEGARLWKFDSHVQTGEEQSDRTQQVYADLAQLPKLDLDRVEMPVETDPVRNPLQPEHNQEEVSAMVRHLMSSLEGLVHKVFNAAREGGIAGLDPNEKLKVRWVEAYFPFTSPSFELEVFWQGDWLELLGCGIVKQNILNNAGLHDRAGWAWGIGIERLAMLLFGIPDIRLFWSQDARFLNQFRAGQIKKFESFSKFPACYKDVAFWIDASPAAASPLTTEPANTSSTTGVAAAAGGDATKASPTEVQPAAFHENDVMEIVRDVAGSLAEDVKLVDEFVHPTKGRKSLCYRINYRSLERTLTNEEINRLHGDVCDRLVRELRIELR